MPLLRTVTLGCKVNQYETEFVRQGLGRLGYRDAQQGEAADLCVVNTCTVTHEADAKSRQTIRQLARRNPGAPIIVLGCYATRARDEVAALPGVTEVITDKRELPDLLGRFGLLDIPTGLGTFAGRQRAWVKVQDGCMLSCSYCIIPQVRPHLASRPIQHILDEVRRLVDAGFHELVLTGIHLGHYGVELNRGRPRGDWLRLADLLRRIARLPGDFRVRLSSIEATEVTCALLAVMAEFPQRICPHLHVAMQSGSDAVLRRMRRRWGAKRFVDRCLLARRMLDQPALTTDVIVGFPGETEADFQATCDVARHVGFMKLHIFPFSPRRGTPAATMLDPVPPPRMAERHVRLAKLETQLRDDYLRSLLGRRLRVLIESGVEGHPDRVSGTACRYATVELHGTLNQQRQLAEVTAAAVVSGRIVAACDTRTAPR